MGNESEKKKTQFPPELEELASIIADTVGEETVTIGAQFPPEVAEIFKAVIDADTHTNKSDIVQKAVYHYLSNVVRPEVRAGAKKILRARRETLKALMEPVPVQQ